MTQPNASPTIPSRITQAPLIIFGLAAIIMLLIFWLGEGNFYVGIGTTVSLLIGALAIPQLEDVRSKLAVRKIFLGTFVAELAILVLLLVPITQVPPLLLSVGNSIQNG